ncbi:NUDIX hydrolase [Streptomyces sp. NPDC060366]|uniref:NUDIX hydrolase n=1 Tax=Streptomyces sp. NPDC060366 TaxID=3347105 RepID=UPI00366975F2
MRWAYRSHGLRSSGGTHLTEFGQPAARWKSEPMTTRLIAAVLVTDPGNGRILILRRSSHLDFTPGEWDAPSGKGEPGEPITATAVRELKEETGVVAAETDLRLVHVVHGSWGAKVPGDVHGPGLPHRPVERYSPQRGTAQTRHHRLGTSGRPSATLHTHHPGRRQAVPGRRPDPFVRRLARGRMTVSPGSCRLAVVQRRAAQQ